METEKPQLGFIGMGGMGSRMAARLLAAGYDLTIYNRNRERTRPLETQGATVAAEPGQLAAHVDIVLSSLADDAAVENVMLGPDGTLVLDRKSTRLNSSHVRISYAVFCLKNKRTTRATLARPRRRQ